MAMAFVSRIGLTLAVAAYAWWAVGRSPFSAPATGAVLAGGVAAMACGAWRATREPSRPVAHLARRAWWWAAVALAAGGWQLAAYLQHPREDHPTLSSLANAALDSHPTRAAAYLVWMAGAAALARR